MHGGCVDEPRYDNPHLETHQVRQEKIKIGIPVNEKVAPVVRYLLKSSKIAFSPKKKHFFLGLEAKGVIFVFTRMSEIATLTRSKTLDAAFLTKDYAIEISLGVLKEWPSLCPCNLAFVMPQGKSFPYQKGIAAYLRTILRVKGERASVASRFPALTTNFLISEKKLVKEGRWEDEAHESFPEIITVGGSEELYPLMDRTDLAVARIETGETLHLHNLVVVEHIMTSHLVFVGKESPKVMEFVSRLV